MDRFPYIIAHLFKSVFSVVCSKAHNQQQTLECSPCIAQHRKKLFFFFAADNDKSNEDRQKEEELLQQIHKLVETRDFLVDDVEFERLRCASASVVLLELGSNP